jgi:hypothetical protein
MLFTLVEFISLHPISGSQYWLSVSCPFHPVKLFLLYRKFCATKVLSENGLPDAAEDKLPLRGKSNRVCSLYDKNFEDEFQSTCGQSSHTQRNLTKSLKPASGISFITGIIKDWNIKFNVRWGILSNHFCLWGIRVRICVTVGYSTVY